LQKGSVTRGLSYFNPDFYSYFCPMLKLVCGIFLSVISLSVTAQIRLDKLVLKPGQHFTIEGSDILVVDTLVMGDSSRIILNKAKADDYIHARIARIGKGCSIEGSGKRGADGTNGAPGADQLSPCRQANPGADANDGTSGETGSNLFIYSDDIQIDGSLTINLNGGDGGDGGDGGQGGGGGPGTRVCPVAVSVDCRGPLLLHAIPLTHSTGPQNMLISVEIDRLESWTPSQNHQPYRHCSTTVQLGMAITQIYDKFVQGDDISITLSTEEDTTGYTAESKLENVATRATVATFVPTVSANTIVLALDAGVTTAILAGKYRWSVRIISPLGKKTTIITGVIEIVEST
jgi:hypothetical protein